MAAIILSAACSTDSPTSAFTSARIGPAGVVRDLVVLSSSVSKITLGWTEVSDGAGGAASYRVKYAKPPIRWGSATIGCSEAMVVRSGDAKMSCTVEGL